LRSRDDIERTDLIETDFIEPGATVSFRRPLAISRFWWQRLALVVLAVALQVDLYTNSGYSWHFFADAASLLVGQHPPGMVAAGGLHLYANYPQFQFGPLALLVTVALRPFANGGWLIITWLMTLCGVGVLYLLEVIVRTIRPTVEENYHRATILTVLVGGGSFVLSWELLAVHFGHLDDVLALTLITLAALFVVFRSPVAAGACIGLAADAKPWALVCAALLLMFPGRVKWRGIVVALAVIVVAWLPFVLADPHTLSAAKFGIDNVPASALRALGVNTPTTPSWDRIAQLAIGCALGVVAIVRRRWEAVIALGIGARLVLDPSVYTYYTAGLALGVLLWDLTGYRRPMPILSVLCFGGITLAAFATKDARLLGEARLWTVLIACGVMLAVPRPADVETPGLPDLTHHPAAAQQGEGLRAAGPTRERGR